MSTPRGVVIAKFKDWCNECDCRIEPGEEIVKADLGGWIHWECPEVVELDKPGRFDGTSSEGMGF